MFAWPATKSSSLTFLNDLTIVLALSALFPYRRLPWPTGIVPFTLRLAQTYPRQSRYPHLTSLGRGPAVTTRPQLRPVHLLADAEIALATFPFRPWLHPHAEAASGHWSVPVALYSQASRNVWAQDAIIRG